MDPGGFCARYWSGQRDVYRTGFHGSLTRSRLSFRKEKKRFKSNMCSRIGKHKFHVILIQRHRVVVQGSVVHSHSGDFFKWKVR